jgi:hypothetical protein
MAVRRSFACVSACRACSGIGWRGNGESSGVWRRYRGWSPSSCRALSSVIPTPSRRPPSRSPPNPAVHLNHFVSSSRSFECWCRHCRCCADTDAANEPSSLPSPISSTTTHALRTINSQKHTYSSAMIASCGRGDVRRRRRERRGEVWTGTTLFSAGWGVGG